MSKSGVTMPEIANVLGHTDSRITEAIYAKFSPTYLRKGVSALALGGEQSVADFQAIAYQFLSIKEPPMGVVRRPASQVGTKITFEFSVIGKPFDISFASIKGRNPDIGVIQYVNSSDHYADMRWPTCVQAEIKIETDRDMAAADAVSVLLLDIRDALSAVLVQNPLFDTTGHLSRHAGYRRSYAAPPNLDIARNRRPRPSDNYHSTAIGEYLGHGVITLNDPTPMDYVWSQIVPFPNVTDIATDRIRLLQIIKSMRLHYNSYNELRNARAHLSRAYRIRSVGRLESGGEDSSICGRSPYTVLL